MSKNYVQPGDTITCVAPAGGVTSGEPVKINSLFGIAEGDADAGENFELTVVGVHMVDKTSAQAWAVGQPVYWDATNSVVTTAAAGILIGVAAAVAANPSSYGMVRLNGHFGGDEGSV